MAISHFGIHDLLTDHIPAIVQIARDHHARNVRVFGSVARGQATSESDIDFLVTFDKGATIWDHVGLIQSLSDLLGRAVDVAADDSLKPMLKARVLAEAVPLIDDAPIAP